MAAVPQAVQLYAPPLQLHRHHSVGTAVSGKAGRLGEGPELDGTGTRPLNFKDGMGHLLAGDERLIGGIKQNDRAVRVGVIHPDFQLLPAEHRAGGVIGRTEVDDIGNLLGRLRGKAVLLHTGHINQPVPPAKLLLVLPCPAGHGVGVHIDRIHRVAHRHHIIHAKDVADIAAVALGSVGHKNLSGLDIHPPGGVIAPGNGLPQELVALLRAIAAEALHGPHLVHRPMHSLEHGGNQRPGHIAYGQLDNRRLRMGGSVGVDAPGHLRKEVAARQLQKVFIDFYHGGSAPSE